MINIVKKYSNNSIEELKKKGIYLIYFKNKLGFYYVGSTKCKDGFYRRWYQHLYKLRKNEHSSPFLQNIYNKYKEDNSVFEIDGSTFIIGKASIIKHLQQNIKHVGMRFFYLIEKND